MWFTKAVPALGGALSDKEAYRYLPRSVAYLPPAPVLRRMLLEAGFSAVGIRPLAGGLSQLVVPPAPGTSAVTGAALHARTVPLEYGPDALQFDGSPTVLFDRPGLTLVGWGTAQLVAATEAAAALAAIPCEDAVRRPGSGPVALGALPFLDAMDGHLVIPRFTMGISRDADGVTRRWATAVGPADARAARDRRTVRCRHLAVRHDARRRRRPGRRRSVHSHERARPTATWWPMPWLTCASRAPRCARSSCRGP